MSDAPQSSPSPSNRVEPPTGAVATERRRANRPLRSAVAVVIGVVLIVVLRARVSDNDYQNANLLSLGVGLVTALYVLFQLHRFFADRGSRWIVPGGLVVTLTGLLTVFAFEGFSGEMWPQFRYRFGQRKSLRTEVSPETDQGAPAASAVGATAADDSDGFLASSHNGVIETRQFDIPSSETEIQRLWDQGIGEGWSSFAVHGDRAVTMEQREDQECVTCYRLVDGQLLWIQQRETRHENTLGGIGPRATPTIDQGRVYAQGATGFLWCLDLETGEVNWTVDLVERAGWDQLQSEAAITWGRAGSPLLIDRGEQTPAPTGDVTDALAEFDGADPNAEKQTQSSNRRLCVVPLGAPLSDPQTPRGLIALDAETGDEVWAAGENQISYASPVEMTLSGRRQIVIVNEATVTGHAVEDGTELWSFPWLGRSNANANCASAVPVGDNRLLLGKGYGGGSALLQVDRDGDEFLVDSVWESTRVLKTKFTHACVDGQVAYALSNGTLEAVDLEEGDRLWQQPRGGRFQQGQPLLVDDTLIVQAETGEIAFVEANEDEYRELLRIPAMTSKTWNIPTVAGRHLLVRNDREAICFLLPERSSNEPAVDEAVSQTAANRPGDEVTGDN